MTAIEWYRKNHLIEIGADGRHDWTHIQEQMQNERMIRERLSSLVGDQVVELADPTLSIHATVLDAATLNGRLIFEFKCCQQGLDAFDRGEHKGVAVQVHKVEKMRDACGRGAWKVPKSVTPFQDAWYVYWDGGGQLAYLSLAEIEEYVKTYTEIRSLNGGGDSNNTPAYSIPFREGRVRGGRQLWHTLGWMPRRPFTMDDIIAGQHRAYLTDHAIPATAASREKTRT